ncbi:MAG TPA: ribonuclease H-like domain-containing protein [Abditibacteriaceae bacterium]|nr:ribonuclease H-like domain-containing protein [Abditibacteriaceae bacterium]
MHFVYFDVETERAADEVGGWSNIEQLGLAIAVTHSSRDDEFRIYRSHEAVMLVEELRAADCVVGFNLRGFDFRVVQPYVNFNVASLRNLDLLLDLKAAAGHRVALSNCCAATFGEDKSGDGLQSVAWWKAGRHQEVIEYCKQDVALTRRLHEFGARHGFVKIKGRDGRLRTLPVPWKLDDAPAMSQQGSLF